MAHSLTTAGLQHIAKLVNGDPLVNSFDALELGQNLASPAMTDTIAAINPPLPSTLMPVAANYPVLGDDDIRNEGRGADVYSWLFEYAEGIEFIASKFVVTNYKDGAPTPTEPVMVSSLTTLAKRADQVMSVWVNVSSGGTVSVVSHLEAGTPLVEQLATWRQQSIVLSGAPGATPVSNSPVHSRLTEGEQVWTAARLLDGDGAVMTRSAVTAVTLSVYRRSGEREWVLADEFALDVASVFYAAPVRTDARWRGTQGYTFAHAWQPPLSWGSRRTRLEYAINALSGADRVLIHEVEWLSTRAR